MLRMSQEVWNIGVVSTTLLLVFTAVGTAISLENSTLADSASSSSHYIYLASLSFSLFALSSLPATLSVPWLRTFLSYKTLVVITTILHVPFYLGLLFLNPVGILIGSAVTGAADAVIDVVIQDFVTCISGSTKLARNLTYYMLLVNFNVVLSSVVSFLCLGTGKEVTMDSENRIKIYGACVGVTLFAALLAFCGMKTPVSEGHSAAVISVEDVQYNRPDSVPTPTIPWYSRYLAFLKEPAVQGIGVSSVASGMLFTYPLILLTCIQNTYQDELLIPIFGFVLGGSVCLSNAVFHKLATRYSYRFLTHLLTWLYFTWLLLVLSVFPADSLSFPLLSLGSWVVYPLSALIGTSLSFNKILLVVTAGRISTQPRVMHGLKPASLFSWSYAAFSVSSAALFALSPHINLYLMVLLSFIGLLAQYSAYLNNLLFYFSYT